MHDDDIKLSLLNIKVNLIIGPGGVWFFFSLVMIVDVVTEQEKSCDESLKKS